MRREAFLPGESVDQILITCKNKRNARKGVVRPGSFLNEIKIIISELADSHFLFQFYFTTRSSQQSVVRKIPISTGIRFEHSFASAFFLSQR